MFLAILGAFVYDGSAGDAAARLQSAAADLSSWDAVEQLLKIHGCSLIAYHLFSSPEVRAACQPPETLMASLRKRYAAAFAQVYAAAPILQELALAFANAGVPALAIKGPSVGAWLYGDPALREYCDFDFVVPEARARTVHALLTDLGYHCVEDPFRSPPLYGGASLRSATYTGPKGMNVDLRFDPLRILWKSRGTRAELFNRWWERRLQIDVNGVQLDTPGPEDQFMFFARHLQAHEYARAKWIVDILLLLRRCGADLDWQAIGREARAYGIQGGLYRTLEVLDRVYGAQIPEEAWAALRPNIAVRALHRRVWPDAKVTPSIHQDVSDNPTPLNLRPGRLRETRQLYALALFLVDQNRAQNVAYLARRMFPPRAWLRQTYAPSRAAGSSYITMWYRHARAGLLGPPSP